jgi:hypothetical protein
MQQENAMAISLEEAMKIHEIQYNNSVMGAVDRALSAPPMGDAMALASIPMRKVASAISKAEVNAALAHAAIYGKNEVALASRIADAKRALAVLRR